MESNWTIQTSKYGIPLIKAKTQLDAVEALGYATAKDRLIQMEFFRRFVTGSLAQLYGISALKSDMEMIKFDFAACADKVVDRLCNEDIDRLNAYCTGVNRYIETEALPMEFDVLKYRPPAWTPQSCVLVSIYTHYILNYQNLQDEIMMTTLRKQFDEQLYYFYTPDTDRYTNILIHGNHGNRNTNGFPFHQIKELYQKAHDIKQSRKAEITTLMEQPCRIELVFEGHKSYAAFRKQYILGEMQADFDINNKKIRTAFHIDHKASSRLNSIDETTEEIHIEGFLPEYLKSLFSDNANLFDIKVVLDVKINTSQGMGHLTLVRSKYIRHKPYESPQGSNCMIVNGRLSKSGFPMIANDPHLPLTFPNLFYMVSLEFDAHYVQGFMIPGTPLIVSGNTKNVCWGITSTASDFMDLIFVEESAASSYRQTEKTIKVKSVQSADFEETVQFTTGEYGPLLERKLEGKHVCIKWTASDPGAYDFYFANMETASSTQEAVEIAQKAGCVPVNLLVGDTQNNIAWTIAGYIPKRVGFYGDTAQYWEEGKIFWDGYMKPDEKPVIVNPQENILVSANDRIFGQEYPYRIGHDFANGWRTNRITELLSSKDEIDEETMWSIQRDNCCEPYHIYYKLIHSVQGALSNEDKNKLDSLFSLLEDWNKYADKDNHAMLVVHSFRDKLIHNTILPLYYVVGDTSPFFTYHWYKIDEVVMSLWYDASFYSNEAAAFYGFADRQRLLISLLYEVKTELSILSELTKKNIEDMTWGDLNQANPSLHALGFSGYSIFRQLNKKEKLPKEPLNGCTMAVNAVFINVGPLFRCVINLQNPTSMMLNHLGGNYGSLLTDNQFNHTNLAWTSGEKVMFKKHTE